jgi:hypothetical protein
MRNTVHVGAARAGRGSSIFIGNVSLMNMLAYIHRFCVTDEYILIFLGTEESKELYSSALCSSVILSVNRGIYIIFISYTDIFIGCNRRFFVVSHSNDTNFDLI